MQEKLRELMKHEGLKPGQLAELLGINPAAISHIMAGRNKPGFELLQKILRRFPQINPDWLLVDRGPMYRTVDASENSVTGETPEIGNLFTAPAASVSACAPEPTATPRHADRTEGVSRIQPDTAQRRATRVVIFYDDQSFESYAPSNA